jgi:hypothetical protein
MVQIAASGKELRASYQGTPRWRYEIPLNFARITGFSVNTSTNEMAAILGLFNAVKGQWDSFLYTDPYSNTAVNTPFGTGDGSTTAFQLLDIEGLPIFDLNGTPTLTRTDWQGTQTLYSTPRTNYALRSEAIGLWNLTAITVTANNWTAPNGSVTGNALVESTATSTHQANRPFDGVAGQPFTYSIYFKPGTRRYIKLALNDGTTYAASVFDTQTGTVFSTQAGSASVANLGGGIYRAIITGTGTTTGSGNGTIYMQMSTDGSTLSYAGDGTSSVLLWGAQLERSAVATSYIPTTTAAVTLTDYTLSSTGLVTLGQAPVSGAALAWRGSYYRRVRFDMDEYEQEQMFNLCWNGGTIKLISVK